MGALVRLQTKLAARLALVVLSSLSLTACAVFNPYVSRRDLPAAGQPTKNKNSSRSRISQTELSEATTKVLEKARGYADAMDVAYRQAARDHANTKTWLAFSTTGLAGFSAFRQAAGQTGGGNDLVPATALFGATAVQWADLLISSPRQGAYMLGSNAVLCAKRKTDGYLIEKADEDSLSDGALASKVDAVQRGVKAVTTLAASEGVQDDPGVTKTLTAAEDELALSEGVRDSLTAYQGRRRQSGLKLISTVDRIGNEIDLQVLRTEVSISAIRAALNSAAFKPPAAPAPAASGTPKSQSSDAVVGAAKKVPSSSLNTALSKLASDTEALRSQRLNRAGLLARLSAAEQSAGGDDCRVAGVAPLSVDAPTKPLKAGGELRVTIKGSEIMPPTASIEGDAKGLTVEVVVQGGGAYQASLKADAQAATGERTLVVMSGDRAETQKVTFKVEGGAGGGSVAANSAPAWLQGDHARVLAYGSSTMGADWTKVVVAYATEHKVAAPKSDGTATEAMVAKLNDAIAIEKASKPRALTEFELWWVEQTRVRKLQKQLGVEENGAMDVATRQALKTPAKGADVLSPDLVKSLKIG